MVATLKNKEFDPNPYLKIKRCSVVTLSSAFFINLCSGEGTVMTLQIFLSGYAFNLSILTGN
jgi:hypothetical protein